MKKIRFHDVKHSKMLFYTKTSISIFLILCFNSYLNAQLLIGEWQNHLNYRECFWVTQNSSDIIVSTGKSLIYIDKNDLSNQYFSKIDGLSEGNIGIIKYDKFNNQLFVFYRGGGFDIVKQENIEYFTAIKKNTSLGTNRDISDIHIASAQFAYLSTSFGAVEFDLVKKEFKSTIFTTSKVNSITSSNQYLMLATDDGIFYTPKSNTLKEDFSKWKPLNQNHGLPLDFSAQHLEVFEGKIYASIENELYTADENFNFTKVNVQRPSGFNIEWMSAEGSHLIIGLKDESFSSETRFIDKDGKIEKGGGNCINRTKYGIEDEKGRVWYADEWRQIRYTSSKNGGCNKIEFDSPFSYESSHVEVAKNYVAFAAGGATENFFIDYNRSGTYILNKDQSWTNINETYQPEISQRGFIGYYTVAPHPSKENILYMGSYLGGITELDLSTKAMKFYRDKDGNGSLKSSLQDIIGAPGQIRVTHLKFDEGENLWICNYGAPKPLCALSKEGTWHNFSIPGSLQVSKMSIDQQGRKWLASPTGSSVVVYDDNNTLTDPSDDRTKLLNSSNSLIASTVHCVETDLNGDVWVGTANGPIIFDCDPFTTDCKGSQRKVLQDSIAALLLETEEIFCIEVDGSNKKWFGTRNGIFVQSSDGETQIEHYTIDNSPLLNNQIVDLDFDGANGLMYISTLSGIQSIKTNATEGGVKNSSSAYAYPNPVRPEYSGPIAIKGLARDANVKITDVNGRLVFETTANGGQAIWNGQDYKGNKADTGVYLVFSTNEQSETEKDVLVTKILIVK